MCTVIQQPLAQFRRGGSCAGVSATVDDEYEQQALVGRQSDGGAGVQVCAGGLDLAIFQAEGEATDGDFDFGGVFVGGSGANGCFSVAGDDERG